MDLQPILKTRKARKDSYYNRQEMAVISVHKQEYLSQTNAEGRGQVFRHKICPDIFNHWEAQGMSDLTGENIQKVGKVSNCTTLSCYCVRN